MATITLPSEAVIKAAVEVIKRIRKICDEENEKMIAREMKSWSIGWKGFYKPTREQARKYLIEDKWSSYPSQYAWGDLSKAKKLLLIAQVGDPVTLNEDDVEVLFG